MGPTSAGKGAPDLSVNVAGIRLKNPVIAASGTFGYGLEFEDVVHLNEQYRATTVVLRDRNQQLQRLADSERQAHENLKKAAA